MTTQLQSKLRLDVLYERKDTLAELIFKAQTKIEIYKRQREELEQKVNELDSEIIREKERGAKP
jgi:cell division protein FtsB